MRACTTAQHGQDCASDGLCCSSRICAGWSTDAPSCMRAPYALRVGLLRNEHQRRPARAPHVRIMVYYLGAAAPITVYIRAQGQLPPWSSPCTPYRVEFPVPSGGYFGRDTRYTGTPGRAAARAAGARKGHRTTRGTAQNGAASSRRAARDRAGGLGSARRGRRPIRSRPGGADACGGRQSPARSTPGFDGWARARAARVTTACDCEPCRAWRRPPGVQANTPALHGGAWGWYHLRYGRARTRVRRLHPYHTETQGLQHSSAAAGLGVPCAYGMGRAPARQGSPAGLDSRDLATAAPRDTVQERDPALWSHTPSCARVPVLEYSRMLFFFLSRSL
jgi:hypothetical protein